MKIIVLGAGVVGVTTAFYLAKKGHEVQVIDRAHQAAEGTSFANAGQISAGYASPWAAPGIPLKALKWLFMEHGPLVIKPRFDAELAGWMMKMLSNCTKANYQRNKSRMMPLAEYSRGSLRALRSELGISFDERSKGILQIFRTAKQYDSAAQDLESLVQFGVTHALLDAKSCAKFEPALAQNTLPIAGGLHFPDDDTGDCHLFSNKLVAEAKRLGVQFHFNTEIKHLETSGGKLSTVITSGGTFSADACVVALGTGSRSLLKSHGVKLPIYPVKGYSLTIPLSNADAAPVSTVMDETYKVAITRLGDRIRVGGTAELAGYDTSLNPKRRGALERSFKDLFPNSGDVNSASFWSGLRPMTPDGPPLIGASPVKGIYLNTGHGTFGWTMACGSARVIADIIDGSKPDIDITGLGLDRYQMDRRS
ncbi:D-amino acid dehydrogenase [Ahrensia marina]|uniref:D-amino acid dehydrogenase n=1 Tax=Ahrensia marina TaxID=1514904 RepID=A0A0M9GMY0_9HYPH|nr:D-amino acid dehydrogenase [Ahrensia marina]KPB01543.1 amino acid dehydrogenase [Ahrensia marina]